MERRVNNDDSPNNPTSFQNGSRQAEEEKTIQMLNNLFQENVMSNQTEEESKRSNPFFTIGLATAFVIAHGAMLLSLPPVILGRGAPFLPTTQANMDKMFTLIRKQPQIRQKLHTSQTNTTSSASSSELLKIGRQEGKGDMTFVDLGSGDGRIVFRAARESNLFTRSIGYEINPGVLSKHTCAVYLVKT